jgi:NADP-reducing hydrogenase subunit HndD
MIKLTIDGKTTEVPAGSTILDAARNLGIEIPTLCYLDMEKQFNQQAAACRIWPAPLLSCRIWWF